ncbi:helix-turn-helix domain-containing protein [Desulfocurvibacter africanus]|uniref:helix-turn-helix domain-containing protein n=1 Tax=Desulfocurvibacter africanus TaxID=873 RepID=UPI0009DBB3ED|nr:helix-turn-helix domain-containing protein [Desulfocurvibacter africanus]
MKSKTPEALTDNRGVQIGGTNSVYASGPEGKDDNSSEAQRTRILEHLYSASLTTLEARRLLDVLHPAARVMELRRAGYRIVTHWTEDITPEGKPHRVARYVLHGEGVA